MRRSLGFQQQCHGDGGLWMESQAQEKSHAFHEESYWRSDNNNYHKQFPGMHMNKPPGMHMNKPGAYGMVMDSQFSMSKQHGNLGGKHGMYKEDMHGGHGIGYAHGGGKKFPFGASHQFSNGGAKFNTGGHHDYFSEETEYESYTEEHVGGGMAKVDGMRYEHHNNWGGDSRFDRNRIGNMNWKPLGAHKIEWTAKGV
ncbi:hypothetical protein VNO77_44080 [Canavalia gladiata]|uniref:Uncharacterized protein n=1 Tax=Canavalia gladiata TaxID=3824 RepID=A0AAN9JYA1_CANGL